jgi:hypothetical protein
MELIGTIRPGRTFIGWPRGVKVFMEAVAFTTISIPLF